MGSLIIKKTDTLLAEYVPLTTADLHLRFLYRFVEPFETVWQEGSVSLLAVISGLADERKATEQYILDEYRASWLTVGPIPDEAKWFVNINKIRLIECEIRRK